MSDPADPYTHPPAAAPVDQDLPPPPPAGQAPYTRLVFPRWANFLLPVLVLAIGGGALYVPTLAGLALHPDALDVGYQPSQPVRYSHALHVGTLGIDCRYCHSTVDQAGFAAIPPTQTCMNCHSGIASESVHLRRIRDSWVSGDPVEWIKVHDLPGWVYFNHAAHINHGVGCHSCHGRVDQMEVVFQAEPMNMAWCLECHREPERFLRPKDQVTSMTYHLGRGPNDLQPEGDETLEDAQLRVGRELKQLYGIKDRHFMESCSTCHR